MIYRHKPAFFPLFEKALRPRESYPKLRAWLRRTVALVDAAVTAADETGFDRTARQAYRLQIDRRAVSAESVLRGIRHHAAQEYPHLLDTGIKHNLTVIYATNLNDRYLALRLCDAEIESEALRKALRALREHLDSIPSSNDLG